MPHYWNFFGSIGLSLVVLTGMALASIAQVATEAANVTQPTTDRQAEADRLSRSVVAAGAPSVLVSLWAVDDGSTSELMSEFYRQLQTQPHKAQALRQAMLKIRKQQPDPFHWAAFTLIGEPK